MATVLSDNYLGQGSWKPLPHISLQSQLPQTLLRQLQSSPSSLHKSPEWVVGKNIAHRTFKWVALTLVSSASLWQTKILCLFTAECYMGTCPQLWHSVLGRLIWGLGFTPLSGNLLQLRYCFLPSACWPWEQGHSFWWLPLSYQYQGDFCSPWLKVSSSASLQLVTHDDRFPI